jgi:hypothetical protein
MGYCSLRNCHGIKKTCVLVWKGVKAMVLLKLGVKNLQAAFERIV